MISHTPRPDLSQTQASFYVYLPLSYMDLSLTLQKETADIQIAKDFLLLLSSIEPGLCCRWSAAVVDKVQVIARCSRPCLRYEDRAAAVDGIGSVMRHKLLLSPDAMDIVCLRHWLTSSRDLLMWLSHGVDALVTVTKNFVNGISWAWRRKLLVHAIVVTYQGFAISRDLVGGCEPFATRGT